MWQLYVSTRGQAVLSVVNHLLVNWKLSQENALKNAGPDQSHELSKLSPELVFTANRELARAEEEVES